MTDKQQDLASPPAHTAGPWRVEPQERNSELTPPDVFPYTIENADWCIAEVYGDVRALSAEANAHLIAAAPELLTAAVWAEGALAPFSKEPAEKSGISRLRAAIARARGQS